MSRKVFINLKPLIAEKSILKVAITDRNDGKTTAAAELAVKTFDKDDAHRAAVFCRRFGTELTDDFFDEFCAALRVHDDTLNGRDFDIIKPSKKRLGGLMLPPLEGGEKRRAVTFLPLSMAGRLKSALGYTRQKNIFIDEYIPLDGRYLKDEVGAILELYKTIDRNHFDNYILVTGNKITRQNPIFEYFNITQWKQGLNTYQNGALSLLIYSNKGNAKECEESTFGDLVKGTAYEAYNAGEFLRNFDELIKPTHSRICLLYVLHKGKKYGAYQSESDLVFDRAPASGGMSAPCVCIEPQSASASCVWLNALPNAQKMLQAYKYTNRLLFADELILNSLQRLYATL